MMMAGVVASLSWLAFGGIPVGAEVDRFEPTMSQDLVGLEDVDFDSDWVPMDSPVQLRFYAHAADSIVIEMHGDGIYDWDAEAIGFEGDLQGGWFLLDVGLQLQASVRFDVAGLQWESDILGPWDYAITSDAIFTPYLLEGNPERPVVIDDHTDGVPVASVPIVPDILVASGNLDVSVAADLTAELAGLRVETTTDGGNAAIVDVEGVASALVPDPGADPLLVDGVMVASMQTDVVLTVRPHLVMSILGQDYEIFGIDIPIALPQFDDTLQFDPEAMEFDAPAPAPSTSGGSEDSGGGSGAMGLDDTGGSAATSTDGDGTGTGDAACCEDDARGCGCRSTDSDSGSAIMLALMVMGIVRRRRGEDSGDDADGRHGS